MDQLFIFLYYHFLDCFEKLACTFLCYTFLIPLFHICNTFITLLWHQLYTFATLLLHPLLHICSTSFTHLLHPLLHCCNFYYYNFDACLFCGILSGFRFVAFCPVAFCPGFNISIHSVRRLFHERTLSLTITETYS